MMESGRRTPDATDLARRVQQSQIFLKMAAIELRRIAAEAPDIAVELRRVAEQLDAEEQDLVSETPNNPARPGAK